MTGQVVRIKHIPNIEVGEPHQCHFNAAEYAIENNCNFVCGWLKNKNSNLGIPHCICEKDGEYLDPTLNREADFKIFHTYTAEAIDDIFYAEGEAFFPFQGNYKSVYDGTRKVKDDEIEEWWEYIHKMAFE